MRLLLITMSLAASFWAMPLPAQTGESKEPSKIQERKATAGKIDHRYDCEKLKKAMKQQERDKRSVEIGVEVKIGDKKGSKPNLYTEYNCDQYDN